MKFLQIISIILFTTFQVASLTAQQGIVMIAKDGVWTYADLTGDPIIEGKEDWKIYPFDPKGVALVNDDGYKLIDASGNWVPTEPEEFNVQMAFFTIGTNFSEGLLKVEIDKKWGMLDHTGKIAVAPKFDQLTAFYGGYAMAELDNQFVVVDQTGNTTPLQNQKIRDFKHFQEGLALVRVKKNKLWGYINPDGTMGIEPQFLSGGYFHDGLAWAKTEDDMVGFIDRSGNWVIEPTLEAARDFDPRSGLAMVKHNNVWKYIDKAGKFHQFDASEKPFVFSDGLSIVKKDDMVGFINNKGELVIEQKYSAVRDFVNGYAGVEHNDKWGLIDQSGKWVLEPTYDGIKDVVLME